MFGNMYYYIFIHEFYENIEKKTNVLLKFEKSMQINNKWELSDSSLLRRGLRSN